MGLFQTLRRWWNDECQQCGDKHKVVILVAPSLMGSEHHFVWCERCEPDKHGLKDYLEEQENNG